VTLKDVRASAGSKVTLLGNESPLGWSQQGADIRIVLPKHFASKYAIALQFDGPIS
jgi:hypothetical protein